MVVDLVDRYRGLASRRGIPVYASYTAPNDLTDNIVRIEAGQNAVFFGSLGIEFRKVGSTTYLAAVFPLQWNAANFRSAISSRSDMILEHEI